MKILIYLQSVFSTPRSLHTCFDACFSASKRTRHASVQSLASQQPAAPPLLHDLPKTSALHCSDPITLNRLQTDIKNTALWENASFPSAVHHSVLITGRGLEENWFTLMTILWVATQQFLFFAPTSLIYPACCCVSVKAGSSVCVGCTEENKGFAGIRPLQQTKGSRKLAVAPSDTWSALNLTGAQGGVGGWKGHCFRVIIFKSLG